MPITSAGFCTLAWARICFGTLPFFFFLYILLSFGHLCCYFPPFCTALSPFSSIILTFCAIFLFFFHFNDDVFCYLLRLGHFAFAPSPFCFFFIKLTGLL
jgi:cadmium resistance protein CadD (predicted permease)